MRHFTAATQIVLKPVFFFAFGVTLSVETQNTHMHSPKGGGVGNFASKCQGRRFLGLLLLWFGFCGRKLFDAALVAGDKPPPARAVRGADSVDRNLHSSLWPVRHAAL